MKPCPAVHRTPAGALHRVRLSALSALSCTLLFTAASAWAQAAAALPAVVVWDFDNQSPGLMVPAERVDFLKRSLSESLTGSLLQVPGLPVVERQRLKDLLAEQKVGAGSLADEDSRLRLGKIVGAARMVFGGFFVLGDQVQVHVRMIDTGSSRVLFSDEIIAPVSGVMQQVEPMNRRLARALGGAEAAAARSHGASTWQAYDRALALADAGELDAAVTALQTLLAQQKDFTPAERQLVALLDKLARR